MSTLIDILACPECHGSLKNKVLGNSEILKCEGCCKEYPFINVVYITDKCHPYKCKKECLSVCKSGKIQYFPWTKTTKRIRILTCNGCRECVNVCSLNAIVVNKTPSFISVSELYNKPRTAVVIQSEPLPELLRKPEDMFMCGHVGATYDYINLKIKEIDPDFVVDDGCGHNLFAAKYGAERAFYTLDGHIDHHAYRKIDLLADGEKLPFTNDSVPMFLSNFVLEHVKNPSIYLNEIKRVLKKDGVLIISTPTQYWHFINIFSLYSIFEYLIKISKNPIHFLKNPWRYFILNKAHEKEHCLDDSKKEKTVLDEICNWRINNWRTLYETEGFNIISKKVTGNLFSGHHLKLCGKIYDPKRIGAHVTFVLNKNEN